MSGGEPLFLQPDVEIDARAGGIFLTRRGSQVRHRLSGGEAIALGLLAHYGDAEPAASDLDECLGSGSGARWVSYVRGRWATYLGVGEPRTFDAGWLRLVATRFVPVDPNRREAAPAALSWLVTLTCNRRCPYCYYSVLSWDGNMRRAPADCTFPFESVVRVLEEMAHIGTADLFLTGGEPLLRPDLVDIVAEASARGIRAHINTKFHADRGLAQALARARVARVTFSLDTADAKLADGLAGSRGFLDEAVQAIATLLAAGVTVHVNAVVSSANAARVQALVDLCVSLGVPVLTLSPYVDPTPTRRQPVNLSASGTPVAELVARLQAQYHGKIRILAGSGEAFEAGPRVDCSDRLLCEVGIRTLDILPDGRVTRCRYAPGAEDLVVGDLNVQSLMDVWTGPALAALTAPPAEKFHGTACGTCSGLEKCNRRGRCLLGARSSHGRIHAPDAGCTLPEQ